MELQVFKNIKNIDLILKQMKGKQQLTSFLAHDVTAVCPKPTGITR